MSDATRVYGVGPRHTPPPALYGPEDPEQFVIQRPSEYILTASIALLYEPQYQLPKEVQ